MGWRDCVGMRVGGDLLGGWVEIGLIIVGRPESIIPGVKHVRVTSSME